MIEQETKTTIVCDCCGATIAEGEAWYQVMQSVSVATFDGTAGGLLPTSSASLQLCETDYQAQEKQLGETAATAVRTGLDSLA